MSRTAPDIPLENEDPDRNPPFEPEAQPEIPDPSVEILEDIRHLAEPPEPLRQVSEFTWETSAHHLCDLERLMRARDYARRTFDERHRAPREEVVAYNSFMHWEIVRDDDNVAQKLDIAINALELLQINARPSHEALILLSDAIGWDDWKRLPPLKRSPSP